VRSQRRSQIAAVLLEKHARGRIIVRSAGSAPAEDPAGKDVATVRKIRDLSVVKLAGASKVRATK
jgi:protein-tyrosine-phosphatase